jgi:hypothetical protein
MVHEKESQQKTTAVAILNTARDRVLRHIKQKEDYLSLFGFLVYFFLYVTILVMSKHRQTAFNMKTVLEDILVPGTPRFTDPNDIYEWLDGDAATAKKGVLDTIWEDPTCGNGHCEGPLEIRSWATNYGCKKDCGEYDKVTSIWVDLQATFRNKSNISKLFWNLCSPTQKICYYTDKEGRPVNQGFTSMTEKITRQLKLLDGKWQLQFSGELLLDNTDGIPVIGQIFSEIVSTQVINCSLPTSSKNSACGKQTTQASGSKKKSLLVTLKKVSRQSLGSWRRCAKVTSTSQSQNTVPLGAARALSFVLELKGFPLITWQQATGKYQDAVFRAVNASMPSLVLSAGPAGGTPITNISGTKSGVQYIGILQLVVDASSDGDGGVKLEYRMSVQAMHMLWARGQLDTNVFSDEDAVSERIRAEIIAAKAPAAPLTWAGVSLTMLGCVDSDLMMSKGVESDVLSDWPSELPCSDLTPEACFGYSGASNRLASWDCAKTCTSGPIDGTCDKNPAAPIPSLERRLSHRQRQLQEAASDATTDAATTDAATNDAATTDAATATTPAAATSTTTTTTTAAAAAATAETPAATPAATTPAATTTAATTTAGVTVVVEAEVSEEEEEEATSSDDYNEYAGGATDASLLATQEMYAAASAKEEEGVGFDPNAYVPEDPTLIARREEATGLDANGCSLVCAEQLGDGYCDKENCLTKACQWDLGDCNAIHENSTLACATGCPIEWLTEGWHLP